MNAAWNGLLAALLRPARPLLAQCRARAEEHANTDRHARELHAQALADCRARIELARSSVFEAGDGVVDARMTALEREWLALARAERPNGRGERALLAQALASDPEGIVRAESCARHFASTLSAWGLEVGATMTWLIADEPVIGARARADALLDVPLRALTAAIAPTYGAEGVGARAQRLERELLDAASDSPIVADVALVARVDFFWRACAIDGRCVPAGYPNAGRKFDELESPAAALLDLWRTGYVLTAIDSTGMTLGAPQL
jgi:hypothetical protein